MRYTRLLLSIVVGLVLVVGCSNQEQAARSVGSMPGLKLVLELPTQNGNLIFDAGKEYHAKAWLTNTVKKDINLGSGRVLGLIVNPQDREVAPQHFYATKGDTLARGQTKSFTIPFTINRAGGYWIYCDITHDIWRKLTPRGSSYGLRTDPFEVWVEESPQGKAKADTSVDP